MYCQNLTSYEHYKLKLCSCAQSQLKLCSCAQCHALGTRTKFQLEILTINVINSIVYFRDIILVSSRNVSETTPCLSNGRIQVCCAGLCGGVRFIWVLMYVAQGETDGVKIMLLCKCGYFFCIVRGM